MFRLLGEFGYFEYSVIPVVIKSYVVLVMKCQLICYVMVKLFFELYGHIWLLVLVSYLTTTGTTTSSGRITTEEYLTTTGTTTSSDRITTNVLCDGTIIF
jgi:hypothetical protein